MSIQRSNSALQSDLSSQIIKEVLEDAQWDYDSADCKEIYELRLDLATPAVVTADKANAPVIGLPTLDGFLSYIAFRVALGNALSANPDPELSKELLWQWNVALRHREIWIDFQLPLHKISLTENASELLPLFDCSVGLPIDDDGNVLIPVGGLFTSNGSDLVRYPQVVDSLPLRRRVIEPFGRPIRLKNRLVTGSGSTKALDNRLYFPLTKSYCFLFRGDKDGVKQLLDFAITQQIGLGKKTTLGYGEIAAFEVNLCPEIKATWAKSLSGPIFGSDQFALIKNLPYDYVFSRKDRKNINNLDFFGCNHFALVAANEAFGTYRPPYWLRDQRTQLIRYGSIIQARNN